MNRSGYGRHSRFTFGPRGTGQPGIPSPKGVVVSPKKKKRKPKPGRFGVGSKHQAPGGRRERPWTGETRMLWIEDDDVIGQRWGALLLGNGTVIPPICRTSSGEVLLGREVLVAIVESGVSLNHPVLDDVTPGQVAHIEQVLYNAANKNGWRVGYPDDGMEALLAALEESEGK